MSDHDSKREVEAPTEADAPPTERPPPGDAGLGAPFRPQTPAAVRPGPPPLRPQGTRNSSLPPPVRPIGIPRPQPDGARPKLPPPPPPARPPNAPANAAPGVAGAPDRNRAAIARAEQEIARLHVRLKTLEAREEERKRHAAAAGDNGARLAAIEAKHTADWNALAARLGALESKHGMDASALAARIDDLEAPDADESAGELRARLDGLDTRIELLDQQLSELSGRESAAPQPAAIDDGADARIDAIEARLEALETAQQAELAKLRERIDAIERAGGSAMGGSLRRIKGIGPKYERLLVEAGVTEVAQIAAWTDADIERFATVLNIAPNRIRNAGWIEIARELAGSS
jgi:NADH-quinone oxidoreductase subunit E